MRTEYRVSIIVAIIAVVGTLGAAIFTNWDKIFPPPKPVPSPRPVQPSEPVHAKIVLSQLTCNETEDTTGADECELRVWADGNYEAHRSNLNNGQTWNLNIPLEFQQKVEIQLYDLDNPSFPLYDDHDHLGTITIMPDQTVGSGTFNLDGSDYVIKWVRGD